MFSETIKAIRAINRKPEGFLPLHAPYFGGNEKKYLADTIDSTFVSSVGAYVTKFEEMIQERTGSKFAIAATNGTIALHLALVVAGVKAGDEVITQSLSFVATANAIVHAQGTPVFLDVDQDTMGLSAKSLETFFINYTIQKPDGCYNKLTGKRIGACVPMHTFGLPLRITEIRKICNSYNIPVIEDAAESIGSYSQGKHTGNFGLMGVFSFNGNKTITCGGGGVLITNDEKMAKKARHLSTTAKIPHPWEFDHDEIGFNYRMPNLNAALACAQLEQLDKFLKDKQILSEQYQKYFDKSDFTYISGINDTKPNYWLNCILCKDKDHRDGFLKATNENGVMTRPAWKLNHQLPMYRHCYSDEQVNAEWLADRIVNIPSSFREAV